MGQKIGELKALVRSKGLKYVGTRGNLKAPICFVGESPGADEDQTGIPFCGQAGKQLDGQINEACLRESDCWFTNPYHVRPPENDLDRRNELGIPDELQLDAFFEELREHKPTFIVAAGGVPTSILCPQTIDPKDGYTKISYWRGSLLHCDKLDWPHYVIPMYHPAFILRDYSERQISVFCIDRVREELEYIRRVGKLQPLPERQLIDDPTPDDVIGYLNDCLTAPADVPISHDIENPFYKKTKIPYVFNFALNGNSAISFNLWDYPLDRLVIIWRLMDKVLQTRRLVGQNYLNYDSMVMEETVGLQPNIFGVEDTMVSHKVLWPEFSHRLEFQTIQYTREPYYKDEGSFWSPRTGKKGLRTYGAKDAAVTWEIWAGHQAELAQRGLLDFYNRIEMPLARNLHTINQRGVLIDSSALAELRKKLMSHLTGVATEVAQITKRVAVLSAEEEKLVKKLKGKTHPVFNINSPKQVGEVFKELKIKLPTAGGKPSTDEEALQKSFALTGHRLPKLILETRGLSKLKGTYIDARLVDGVLYTQYVNTGTVNGRRSSGGYFEKTIFAFGTNLQNLPKHGKGIIGDFQADFRRAIVARPGKIYLACDQVQAEDWVVQGIIADQSGDRRGIDELLAGTDRHKKLAAFIFSKPEAECGKESHERFLGKKTRHAGNYDMQAFRFSVVLAKEGFHIPENDCELLLVRFHQYDPGIKQVFHKYIQQRLEDTRTLVNCFGRERIFFGLHPYRDNTKVFKEAYSCLPQSTVSDNTAQALNIVEAEWHHYHPSIALLKDDHDALTLEVEDSPEAIQAGMALLEKSFDREVVLEKGLRFKIPIEFELGYNLKDMKGITQTNFEEKRAALLTQRAERQLATTN